MSYSQHKLTFEHYQMRTAETAVYPPDAGINYCILGLTNEAGEVAGKYKKFLRGDKDWDVVKAELIAELGDVLWYASQLANELGTPLEDIAAANLSKLKHRKDAGTLKGDGDKR